MAWFSRGSLLRASVWRCDGLAITTSRRCDQRATDGKFVATTARSFPGRGDSSGHFLLRATSFSKSPRPEKSVYLCESRLASIRAGVCTARRAGSFVCMARTITLAAAPSGRIVCQVGSGTTLELNHGHRRNVTSRVGFAGQPQRSNSVEEEAITQANFPSVVRYP